MPSDDILVDVLEFFDRVWLERLEMVGRRLRYLIRRYFRHRPLERRTVRRFYVSINLANYSHKCQMKYDDKCGVRHVVKNSIPAFHSFFTRRPSLAVHVVKFYIQNRDDLHLEQDESDANHKCNAKRKRNNSTVVPHQPDIVSSMEPVATTTYPFAMEYVHMLDQLHPIWLNVMRPYIYVGSFGNNYNTRTMLDAATVILDLFRLPSLAPRRSISSTGEKRRRLRIILGETHSNSNFFVEFFSKLDVRASTFAYVPTIDVKYQSHHAGIVLAAATFISKYVDEKLLCIRLIGGTKGCAPSQARLGDNLQEEFPQLLYRLQHSKNENGNCDPVLTVQTSVYKKMIADKP